MPVHRRAWRRWTVLVIACAILIVPLSLSVLFRPGPSTSVRADGDASQLEAQGHGRPRPPRLLVPRPPDGRGGPGGGDVGPAPGPSTPPTALFPLPAETDAPTSAPVPASLVSAPPTGSGAGPTSTAAPLSAGVDQAGAGAPAPAAISSPSPTVPVAGTKPVAPPPPTSPPPSPPAGGACAPAPADPTVLDVTATGARPGDSGDDTAAIQAAIAAVPSGETVLVPDGVYLIKAETGIRPKSSMTLRLSPGAVLRAVTASSGHYNVIRVESAHDVTITGGTVEGDLGRHAGTEGQFGHGVAIHSSDHVVVESVTARDAWGDGFFVGFGSSQVTLCRVTADHNRRQGLSAVDVDRLSVRDSVFTRTVGEPGGAGSGIDLEPDAGTHVSNVEIRNSTITDNAVHGISLGMDDAIPAGTATITGVRLIGNTVDNNGLAAKPQSFYYGIQVSDATGTLVEANTVTRTHGVGIGVLFSTSTTVRSNRVTGNVTAGPQAESGGGIYLQSDRDTTCTGDTLSGNAAPGITSWQSGSVATCTG